MLFSASYRQSRAWTLVQSQDLDPGVESRVYTDFMSSLKIGALAKAAGIPIDTVRYYEKTGLLPAPRRTESGYRAYDPETVQRLHFIRNSKKMGFTLQEIAQLLELSQAGARSEVRRTAREKVRVIDQRIAELTELRQQLVQLIEECADEQHHPDCPILEALSG